MASSLSLWVILAVALSLGCGASGQERPSVGSGRAVVAAAQAERWLELRTPHFVVHTDSYPQRALELATELEHARAMLLAAAWPKAPDPGGRTRVVIFARPADFNHYSGLGGTVTGAAFTRTGMERTIAFSPGPDGGMPRVVVHELAHDLSHWFFPLQPAWFAEGLAGYLETTRFDTASGEVVMGEASEESLGWITGLEFFASAQELFNATSYHALDPRAVMTFYAGSWFLVTYLLSGEAEAFGRFQKKLHRLVPWRRAWNEAFEGMTTAELDQKLVAYAKRGGKILILRLRMALPKVKPELRALSPAEAHGVKALLASAKAPDVADREMRAALELDPNELNALSVQFRATAAVPPETRQRIAERAVAAHPEAGEAWLLQATAARDTQTRRDALERAAALEPGHPGVALLVGANALERGEPALALERLRFALRRSALSRGMLGLLAEALEANGRCADAVFVAQTASDLFGSDCRDSLLDAHERIGCEGDVQRRPRSRGCKTSKRAAARATAP